MILTFPYRVIAILNKIAPLPKVEMRFNTPKKITAIVIDDDKALASMMVDMLELEGIRVVGTGFNGKDAVKLFKERRPDVVYLDYCMPNYNGAYAFCNIKKIDPNANIIMVTADRNAPYDPELKEVGKIPHIIKPFDINEIMELTNEIVLAKAGTVN